MSVLSNFGCLFLKNLDKSLLSNFGCMSFLGNSGYVTLLSDFGCIFLLILNVAS